MLMTSVLAPFLVGLLGSAHCVGMCGPFAILLSSRTYGLTRLLSRQLCYTLGRGITYSFLAMVLLLGRGWVVSNLPFPTLMTAGLGLLAGGLLISAGLSAVGFWRAKAGANLPCAGVKEFQALLQSPGPAAAFLAGLLNGFIPCGLLYGMLTLAVVEGDLVVAWISMAAFTLGTTPLMWGIALLGTRLSVVWRQRVYRLAGAWLVVLGILSVYQGGIRLTAALVSDGHHSAQNAAVEPAVGCPFCPPAPSQASNQ